MKKVKIMLMAIAILAIAGGSLAFNAKYDSAYCTTTAFYNTVAHTYYCPATLPCPSLTVVFQGQTNPLAPTICYTPAVDGTCIDEGTTLICTSTTQPLIEN